MSKKDDEHVGGLTRTLQSIARWRPLIIPAMILAFVGGATALWWNYRTVVISAQPQKYSVQLEGIQITAPPDWVKSDIRSEVFHDAGWHEYPLSILEPDLAVRVAQAFEQHTWVAKVTRVAKGSPATLNIEVQYRRPVAMVEVDYEGQGGLLPVDASGVLLPPHDFTAEEAVTYPRITADYTGPSGSIGTPWGDERVAGAAKIAALFTEHWDSLGLYRIVAIPNRQPESMSPTAYELHTRGEFIVHWGHAPSRETAGETPADQKIVKLLRYAQPIGKLDKSAEKEIDLRGESELSSRPTGPAR